jgi:lipoate---protein ligase
LRYIEDAGELPSAEGLAGDEALAIAVGRGDSPATLRLYAYRPAVIVGRYQNLTDAVNLDACRRHGHEWNRRHTGGGTVVMGPGQLAIGLALPERDKSSMVQIARHFSFFSRVLEGALSRFGIKSNLMGKNDLAIDGRKVAGLAISQDIEGCAFLHCSLLLEFDVGLMVNLLNLATRDLDDRGQSCFTQRMTTIHEHNPEVSIAKMREAVLHAVEANLGVSAAKSGWTSSEHALIKDLISKRYANDEWIYSSRVMRRWTGSAECKTPGGNLRVYVDRNDSVLDAVLITGDYFSREIEVARLESSLRFVAVDAAKIRRIVAQHACETIYRVASDELAGLILAAAAQSRERGGRRKLADHAATRSD